MGLGDYTYNPETGYVSNKHGKQVGSYTKKYGRFNIDGKEISISRFAVYFMTGHWPEDEVDHKDLDCHNNVWGNLRDATRTQNAQNKKVRKSSKTGYKGVYYLASIQTDKRRKFLGSFKLLDDAVAAYNEAAANNHKQFARIN